MTKKLVQKRSPHFIGPVGGAITKNLVELGEKELVRKEGKNLK